MDNTGKSITLAVTGSIAAYKAVELLRLLRGAGHDVRVVQTPASTRFVGSASFQALSGHPVASELFEVSAEGPFGHIDLAACDLFLVAPATAGTIGKMAAGISDNLLLTTYLATAAPVFVCPAMNGKMWLHPAVQDNVALLERRGVEFIGPDAGDLACGEEGTGRLADPAEIVKRVNSVLGAATPAPGFPHGAGAAGDLAGVNVLVTAGGTREPIDSVRFITNRSSGRMGFALAEAARDRGAAVTVIAANCGVERVPGIEYRDVITSDEMRSAITKAYEGCDVLLMAAAVSDYKVSDALPTGKLERKEKTDLQLVPTSDIVSSLEGNGKPRLKVGFAAEFGEENLDRARQKMREKDLGMIVFNDISRSDIGFDSAENEVTIMVPGREDVFVGKTGKRACAERILDQVVAILDHR